MKKILIIGGGIGGLTAALTLASNGFQVEVFEQAADFQEVGAGIQLSPNCSRILHSLGFKDGLKQLACQPEGLDFRRWSDGAKLATTQLGASATARYLAPYYHIHRADLINLLLQAAKQHDSIKLHTHAVYQSSSLQSSGHSSGHSSGQGSAITAMISAKHFEGDLLIGADGVHSQVRSHWFQNHDPQFTGYVAWRGLVSNHNNSKWTAGTNPSVYLGPGAHFVCYPVRAGELVNWVAVVEEQNWRVESWREKGDTHEIVNLFKDWHPYIGSLLEATDPDNCYKWALYDRKPMSHWFRDKVVLLGDACHPTLPFMAQGGAMAIEDSLVLARCLSQFSDTNNALQAYQRLRSPRASMVQSWSRRNGIIYHLGWPANLIRNLALPLASNHLSSKLFSYNALK